MKDLIRHLEDAIARVEMAQGAAKGYDGFADLESILSELKNMLERAETYYE